MAKIRSFKKVIFDRLTIGILCILSLVFVFPFYWTITGSFKNLRSSLILPPEWFPKTPTMESWDKLFNQPAVEWFFNSFVISLTTMILVCLVATLAGYVLAKKRFFGRVFIFSMFVFAMALPKQVVLVPLVQLVSFLNFHDTLLAVILPAVGWPFGIFLMKQFSESIPTELLEAAKIDGASEIRVFATIVAPMVKPGIGALAIFTFISSWNDYFLQLIMLNSRSNLTLQLGLATLMSEFGVDFGLLMAGATLSALPIIIIFITFQKSFTQGIMIGAVKG